ncbi:MAG TPA: hypothetical protein VH637_22935 [Streptosporangiaceae bacterium]|jgi:hypothetical protein
MTGEPEGLAGRLAAAQRMLAAASFDDQTRARLQRRLTAICDAVKLPGADTGRCARRLDLLVADLRDCVQSGQDQGGQDQAGGAGG